MSDLRLAVVVPTRDRPDLAAQAVRSVMVQRAGLPVDVWVSDNSTGPALRAHLARLIGPETRLIQPPQPLPMVAHWQFALDAVLADPAVSHVAFLTDRMLVRPGELARLVDIVTVLPEQVISFEIDAVLDFDASVRVVLNPWSGDVRSIGSAELLREAASARPSSALPRMLNTVVPRAVLSAMAERYGSVFDSIAPDYCFAFRCLTLVEAIAFYDRSSYVHRASRQSNGANQARGTVSADSQRFLVELDRPLNAAAPVPALRGVLNAIMSEYGYVRAHDPAKAMPAVVLPDYLAAVDRDLDAIRDPALLAEQHRLLAELGHRHIPYEQWRRDRRRAVAVGGGRAAIGRLAARLAGFRATRRLWEWLALAPPSAEWFVWADPRAALNFAATIGRRRTRRDQAVMISWAELRERS